MSCDLEVTNESALFEKKFQLYNNGHYSTIFTKHVYNNCFSIYALLTKREVKMAGYWPNSFFASLWTDTKSKSIKTKKKGTRPISLLDRTSLVNKGFIIWPKGYTKYLL